MIYEYSLEGFHCAGCGERVVREVEALDFVDGAELNLATARIKISAEKPDGDLLKILQKIVGSTGHGVSVKAYNAAAKRLVLGRKVTADSGVSDDGAAENGAEKSGAGEVTADRGEKGPNGRTATSANAENESKERTANNRESEKGSDTQAGNHYKSLTFYLQFFVSAVLFACGICIGGVASSVLLTAAAAVAGYKTVISGIRGLLRLDIDEDLLMSTAAIAACCIGEFTEAAMVLILNLIGSKIESVAAMRSRNSIKKLTEIRPDIARLADGTEIAADEVKVGDLLIVRPYERIAVDGEVISGNSNVDSSAITGESVPFAATEGTALMSGMLNGEGQLIMRATAEAEGSTAARIIRMVEDSAAVKGSSERLITRFAKIYTPSVFGLCILVAVLPPLFGANAYEWLNKGLAILVAACPCALVISVPLAFFAGIGAASKKGVLIKGGRFVERLARVDTVAFDKTGTITDGTIIISEIFTANGYTEREVCDFARIAESGSTHPIARALVESSDCPLPDGNVTEIMAAGVIFVGEKTIFCGSKRLMEQKNVDVSTLPDCQAYVAVNGRIAGGFRFADRVRDNAAEAVGRLKELGVNRVVLLTGDKRDNAQKAAAAAKIDEVYAELLPQDKVMHLIRSGEGARGTVFIGDGINDAPVLAAADVGIAMGLGSDAAIEAADAVLTANSLSSLEKAIKICRKTMKTVRFNIVFPLAVKLAVMLSAVIYPIMWAAVVADVVVMLITVLNSARLIK